MKARRVVLGVIEGLLALSLAMGLSGCLGDEARLLPTAPLPETGCFVDKDHLSHTCDSLFVSNETEVIDGSLHLNFEGADAKAKVVLVRYDGKRFPLWRINVSTPADTVFVGSGSVTFPVMTSGDQPSPHGHPFAVTIEWAGGTSPGKVELIEHDLTGH